MLGFRSLENLPSDPGFATHSQRILSVQVIQPLRRSSYKTEITSTLRFVEITRKRHTKCLGQCLTYHTYK